MIRSELLDICGMTAPTFNSHRRNGDLPFDAARTEAEDGVGRTWARYTLHHAVRMLAARQLAAVHRVSWSEAARILRTQAKYASVENYSDHAGVHFAQVEIVNEKTNADPDFYPRLEILTGTLQKIVEQAQNSAEAYTRHNPHDAVIVASMVSVNLSQCWKIALALAKSKDIDLSFEGSERAAILSEE